jgi:hypothetical protein
MVSRITASVVADLAVRPRIVGPDQIAGIDLIALDERVDLDGARGFQRHVLELFVRDLDEGVGVDLVSLNDVSLDLFAGFGVDLGVLVRWPVLRLSWLNETFSSRGGRVQRDRACDEDRRRNLPVHAWGHGYAKLRLRAARTQDEQRELVPTSSAPWADSSLTSLHWPA